MLHATFGAYTVSLALAPEDVPSHVRAGALLTERLQSERDDGRSYLAVAIGLDADAARRAHLLVEGWFSPGPRSGFHPGVLVVPETGVVFIGAGEQALSFGMAPPRKLADETACFGFVGWQRQGDRVLMLAELAFAVWNLQGEPLWSRPVEPPWDYRLHGDTVTLDVMGVQQRLRMADGGPA